MGKLNIQGDLDIHNYLSASNTNLYLSSASSDYSIRFRIGTTEVARISPSGCLNINSTQTSDTYKLYVNGKSCFMNSTYLKSTILVNNSTIGGSIAFLPTRSTDGNATGVINYYACGSTSATDYNLGSFYFTQYSYTDGTYNRVEYYDRFYLPAVAAGKTANDSYKILTSKNAVTVAQGGTGRAELTSGYALVGNGTSAVSLREIATSVTSGSTALVTSGAVYSKCANYLSLSGGTITGSVNFSTANQYYDLPTHTGGAIRLNNGDIGGVNSIYFKDAAGLGEGLHFYVSSTTVDTLRASGGVLYFDKTYDLETGTATNTYTIIHTGNYTSYQVDKKVQQSRSTSGSWRALLSHYTATTQGTDPTAATNIVYYNEKASIQPSTGSIYSAGTITGKRIIATSTTDAAHNAANGVALVTGDASGTHLEFDGNEIFAKTSGTAAGTLYLQSGSGNTEISSGGVTTIGSLATFKNSADGGFTFAGRIDVGCLLLTNTGWTGYGTADPESAGLSKVIGRIYFKIG